MTTRDYLRDMEESLVRAHRGRAPVELSDTFTHNVMAAVRREAAESRDAERQVREAGPGFVERLVTRFALGACGAAAACGAYGFLAMRSVNADIAWASFRGATVLLSNPLTGF